MLNDQQMAELIDLLAATAELLGHAITPVSAALMAEDLSAYPIPVLVTALRRVRTEHTGKLTPKAIIDRIDAVQGRLTANEAWSLALQSVDEARTVVWTSEISKAWAQARPILAMSDKFGARNTFIETYERLVREARELRQPPVWQVVLGWDPADRKEALARAVELGHITRGDANQYAVAAELPALPFNPQALLLGRVEPGAMDGLDEATRQRWLQVRDDVERNARRADRRKQAQQRLDRMRFTAKKRSIDAEVKRRLAQEGSACAST